VNNSTSSLETLERYLVCAGKGIWKRFVAGKRYFIASYFYSGPKSTANRTHSTSINEYSNRLTGFFATFSPAIAIFAFGE
jgi:hypothetical protein